MRREASFGSPFMGHLLTRGSPVSIVGRFATVVDYIYPDLATNPSEHLARSFGRNGVWFQHWSKPSPFALSSHQGGTEWLLCRLPVYKDKLSTICITIPPLAQDRPAAQKWHLFDGRHWIRVQNRTPRSITIRPYAEADLIKLLDATTLKAARHARIIRAVLSLIKPADLRRGLPVLARIDANGEDTLMAFPTLNISVEDPATLNPNATLHWDVRYKKIDLGRRSPSEVIVRGIRKNDVAKEVYILQRAERVKTRKSLGERTRDEDEQQEEEKEKEEEKRSMARRLESLRRMQTNAQVKVSRSMKRLPRTDVDRSRDKIRDTREAYGELDERDTIDERAVERFLRN